MGLVKITDLKKQLCECGNDTFIAVMELRIVPKVLSPTGKEEFQPVPIFQCTKCSSNLVPKNKAHEIIN